MKTLMREHSPEFTNRLVITFLFFAVATVMYCVFAIVRINRLYVDVSDYRGPAFYELVEIQSRTTDAIQESFAYVVSGHAVEKEEFQTFMREFPAAAARFGKAARLDEPHKYTEWEKFVSIVELHQDLATCAEKMFAEFESDGKVTGETFEAYEETIDKLTQSMKELVQLEEQQLDAARAASASALQQTKWQLGFLAVVTCALSAASTILLLRSFRYHVVDRLTSRFLQEALSAQEKERSRLARELHDETGSALTSIMIGLLNLGHEIADEATLSRLGKLQEEIELTLDEVKRLDHGLHPLALEQLGFGAAVEQYVVE